MKITQTASVERLALNWMLWIEFHIIWTLYKQWLLVNAFFTSQFNYCPLTRMFHCSKLNKINRFHESCLRLIYSVRISSYEGILDKDNYVPIHQNNLQRLAIKMFKTYTGIAPWIMNEDFPRKLTSSSLICIKGN